MAFVLTDKVKTKVCADQIESIISQPRYRDTKWTDEKLFQHLKKLGLDYTLEEVRALNDEMHERGIVEDVKE